MKPVPLTSLSPLKDGELHDVLVHLLGGLIVSRKTVFYDATSDLWEVYNGIDGTSLRVKNLQTSPRTIIAEALKAGRLYLDES